MFMCVATKRLNTTTITTKFFFAFKTKLFSWLNVNLYLRIRSKNKSVQYGWVKSEAVYVQGLQNLSCKQLWAFFCYELRLSALKVVAPLPPFWFNPKRRRLPNLTVKVSAKTWRAWAPLSPGPLPPTLNDGKTCKSSNFLYRHFSSFFSSFYNWQKNRNQIDQLQFTD